MTDDLSNRLDRLALTPTRTRPPVEELRRRGEARTRRRIGIGVMSAVAVAIVAVIASLSFADGGTSKVTTVTAVESPTTSAPASPPGRPVAGPGGGVVGWIDESAWDAALDDGPPVLDIGTGAVPVRGLEVHDRAGRVVGYYLPGDVGFLPASEAADPAHVDALVRADAPLTKAEAKALLEQLQADASAVGGN